MPQLDKNRIRIPQWLKRNLAPADSDRQIHKQLNKMKLHTVCESALCPNRQECWASGTATFMILGDSCTRNCRFCSVKHGGMSAPDSEEPAKLVETVKTLGIRHVVITSVTRDDLPDEGAGHFAQCLTLLKKSLPDVRLEVLVPDFNGREELIRTVIQARPDIYSHNLETVERLTPQVRSRARYSVSLETLAIAKKINPDIYTKSGLMVGLGESITEIEKTMDDLMAVSCDILTIGQYLRPTLEQLPVVKYYNLEEFKVLEEKGTSKGFKQVVAAPLARSSYHAEKVFQQIS
jgi:lipoic acid synthetase